MMGKMSNKELLNKNIVQFKYVELMVNNPDLKEYIDGLIKQAKQEVFDDFDEYDKKYNKIKIGNKGVFIDLKSYNKLKKKHEVENHKPLLQKLKNKGKKEEYNKK